MEFYDKLLRVIPGREFNEAKWSLCEIKPVGINDNSFNNIISYQWLAEDQRLLIVVNYSSTSSKAHVIIDKIDYGLNEWRFTDLLTGNDYNYRGRNLNENGLYIELDGWKSHIFRVEKV
jgi:hypothetical protein